MLTYLLEEGISGDDNHNGRTLFVTSCTPNKLGSIDRVVSLC